MSAAENSRDDRDGEPRRVVVAEDDDAMRMTLVAWLEGAGFEVTAFSSGVELRDELVAHIGNGLPDAVVTDVHMPGMSGLDALSEAMSEGARVPMVIVITSFGDREIHAEAQAAGANAVFDKPFDLDALIELVSPSSSGEVR